MNDLICNLIFSYGMLVFMLAIWCNLTDFHLPILFYSTTALVFFQKPKYYQCYPIGREYWYYIDIVWPVSDTQWAG